MSNVAALQPGGSERIRLEVTEKDPQAVGKLSEFMKEFTEEMSGFLLG